MSCAEITETINLPFGLWIQVGRRKHNFNRIRQAAPMCPYERARWRHLVNMIELSICSSNAALCKITLTTFITKRYKLTVTLLQVEHFDWFIDIASMTAIRRVTSMNSWCVRWWRGSSSNISTWLTPDDRQPYVLTPSKKMNKMTRNTPRYMRSAGSQSSAWRRIVNTARRNNTPTKITLLDKLKLKKLPQKCKLFLS